MRGIEWEETVLKSGLGEKMPAPAQIARNVLALLQRNAAVAGSPPAFDVTASSTGVTVLALGSGKISANSSRGRAWADLARQELAEYFQGRRAYFSVPADLSGVMGFQRQVLEAARRIPFGETRPYGGVASDIGRPGSARAVGTALGGNPVPILIPCHRVTRSDGSMGGYALGLTLKERLLRLERETPVLVGSITTSVVCRLGCPHERRIGEAKRVVFASVAEAERVGYRRCARCRPAD